MRYFLKSLFLNIVSLFKTNKRISVTEAGVYFDLLALNSKCGYADPNMCKEINQ